MNVQFRIIDLLGVMVLFAGYASLASCETILQATVSALLVTASLIWLICSVGIVRQQIDSKTRIEFQFPTVAFVFGFSLFFTGMFLFIPAAEEISLAQLQIATENGFKAHFEERDFIGLTMYVASTIIGVPVVIFIGICATVPSERMGLTGISRYAMGFAFAMIPLVVGILTIAGYTQQAWHFQSGG